MTLIMEKNNYFVLYTDNKKLILILKKSFL